jgi:hypothetical protein
MATTRQRPAHRVGRAAPEGEVGRDLWPAPQTGPKTRLLRSGGRGEEAAVLELGRTRGANWPAIDAGRGAPHENVAVEASVAALESAVGGPVVEQFHSGTLLHTCALCWPFSDLSDGAGFAGHIRFSIAQRTAYRLPSAQAFYEHRRHDQTLPGVRIALDHRVTDPYPSIPIRRSTRCVPSHVGA